jgi:hypothetical protein
VDADFRSSLVAIMAGPNQGDLEATAFADEDWQSSMSHNWGHIVGG